MSEHWTVRQGGDHGNDPNAYDVMEGQRKVAHLPWCQQKEARLIAAAPDLLLAAKAAVEVADTAVNPYSILGRQSYEALRTAIAKAEGK